MKNFFITALLLIPGMIYTQTKVDTLTNEKVIKLSKLGLEASVIINKIRASHTLFDVSTDSLIYLNEQGVPASVINEMMKMDTQKKSDLEKHADAKDPHTMHKPGIYYYNSNDVNNPVRKIDAARVSSYKASGGGYGGFGGASQLAVVSGAESKQQIAETSPIFYFYFDSKNYSHTDWYDAASPNEFVLVKFIEKKGERLFKTGSSSSFGFSSSASEGIPEKDKIPFDYTEVSEGIYKVTFKKPLPKGEYCFVFATATYKVFDFGVH